MPERNANEIIDTSMNRVAVLLTEVRDSLSPSNIRGRKILEKLARGYQRGNPTKTTVTAAKDQANGNATVV